MILILFITTVLQEPHLISLFLALLMVVLGAVLWTFIPGLSQLDGYLTSDDEEYEEDSSEYEEDDDDDEEEGGRRRGSKVRQTERRNPSSRWSSSSHAINRDIDGDRLLDPETLKREGILS